MDYWFFLRHSSLNNNKLMISPWAFIIMSILLFNMGFAVNQEHQQEEPKGSGENHLQPPNQLHLVGSQLVPLSINYQKQPSGLLLGLLAPQQQLVNQHNNPVVVQSANPQPLPGPLPAIIPSHYLLSYIQQQGVVNPMHLVLLVTPSTHPPLVYQQQQSVNLPMKQDEYTDEFSPDTTPKQVENTSYKLTSIDVNEILFYPDKVLASFVPSGSESFKPLPVAN